VTDNISKVMARRWIQQLIDDNGAVELRVNMDGMWMSGWFDDMAAMSRSAQQYRKYNLYTSINPSSAAIIANEVNRAQGITNKTVTAVHRLFFDFDPERPVDTIATDALLAEAKSRALAFRAEMHSRGWPQPAFAMSGNGCHLMYRSGFKEPGKFLPFYKRLHGELVKKYSDDAIKLDAAVKNPGRLTRLYGSVNRKGTSTPELPHRTSVIWVPESYDKITPQAMWQTVLDYGAEAKVKPCVSEHRRGTGSSGDYSSLDVVGWFQSLGLYLDHIRDNIHAVWCPWSHEHSSDWSQGDCTIFEPDGGWAGFNCKHGHCNGRGILDVMNYLGNADAFCGKSFKVVSV